jgi:hypothetical protein
VVASSISPYGFDIALGEDDNFIVVWGDGFGANLLIQGRRYDPSGAPVGSELEISTAEGTGPAVASDADGDFVVTWRDRFYGPTVLARELDAGGMPRTAPFQVNTYATAFTHSTAIASDEAGNYVVVWQASYLDGDARGVFGQRFAGPDLHLSVDGTCPGPVSVSILNAPPSTEVALVAAASTNGFVKGGALCPGVELEIGEPFQLPPRFVLVDLIGSGSTSMNLAPGRCHVQALALASCGTSNVVVVP